MNIDQTHLKPYVTFNAYYIKWKNIVFFSQVLYQISSKSYFYKNVDEKFIDV